jgi:hypothetical protein
MWIYTSTAPYAFMASCLISYAEGQFYLLSFTKICNIRNSDSNINRAVIDIYAGMAAGLTTEESEFDSR